jgi:hypothetical protein
MKRVLSMVGIMAMVFGIACTKSEKGGETAATPDTTSSTSIIGATSPRYILSVSKADASGNPTGAALYNSTSGGTSLALVEGDKYVFIITKLDSGGPYTYQVSLERVDIVSSGPSITIQGKEGNNLVNAPAPGDYVIKIIASSGSSSFPARTFQASVTCNDPVSLNAAGIEATVSVAGAGTDNLYNYSATVGAGAGGSAPYICAWDFNGDGSRDSYFVSCGTAFNNIYENYVGNRKVGLIVKDSCNTSVSVQALRSIPVQGLTGRTPGDGSVFIHGKITGGTGAAASHPAVFNNTGDPSDYWATNNFVRKPVHTSFRAQGMDSSFTIASDQFTYGAPSSVTFGMKIEMSKLSVVTLGDTVATTTVNATNAVISSVDYSTDRVGDGQPALKLSGGTCTLTDQGLEVIEVKGTPCAPGTTNPDFGDREMRWTFHAWGRYSCTNLTGPASTANIMGEFDGFDDLIDGCVGGGQGGQGGEPPPSF